ncbi:CoA ester lyase [Pseudonocardia nematodicida]|uniref:CoA ester lyase n=1 Tax=Pseudonocardia nematodicida TaxID=1206997 RepID=A0ABV1K7D2_9PSEU
MTTTARSWLYVPGHRPELLPKAFASGADAVVVDLEDAVPPGHKAAARTALAGFLDGHTGPRPWVRVNGPTTPWGPDDLATLAGHRPAGLRLSKTEDPEQVRRLADETGLPLWLVVETGLGLERAYALATAHPAVVGMLLGEADLKADLRILDDRGLGWARGRIVAACAAAGKARPVQSVHTRVGDLDGLRASSEDARARGYFGRSVVHPRQVDVVNEVFTPSRVEVERPRAVVDALAASHEAGSSALLDRDGALIDPAVAEQSNRVLELDRRIRAQQA